MVGDAEVGWYQVKSGLGVVASCNEAAMPGCIVRKGYICRGAVECVSEGDVCVCVLCVCVCVKG